MANPDYIYFPPSVESYTPERVYIVANASNNALYLHCSVDPEQAYIGRGKPCERKRLRPFTMTLWAACERFITWRRAQLDAIGEAYRNLPNQMSLFEE